MNIVLFVSMLFLICMGCCGWYLKLYIEKKKQIESNQESNRAERQLMRDTGFVLFQTLSRTEQKIVVGLMEQGLLLRRMQTHPEDFGRLQPTLERLKAQEQ